MIDELVGIACQAIGMHEARRILHCADTNSTQVLLKALTKVDRSQESAEEFITRDKDWSIRTYGWFRFAKESLIEWRVRRSMRERFCAQHESSEAKIRLLGLDAALALHHQETGRYPAKLDELVPHPFASVPLDPFSGQPMIYRLTTNSYLLYSLGPDQTDDGGKPLAKFSQGPGDILSTPPPVK